jgi:tetratricopeptide (TPR) repeat protein
MPVHATVQFTEWSPQNVDELLAEASGRDRLVMVVITQPDWYPGCIQLDREVLRNPDARAAADLTRDWTVLEVYGYDAPGARFLEEQGLRFLGTPTTLLLRPGRDTRRLGEARQLLALAGYPEDYLERLRRASEGHDATAAAQAAIRDSGSAEAWHGLALASLQAGNAEAARRAYASLLMRDDLPAEQRQALSLESIVQPTQRVEKDHQRSLAELDAWASAHPEGVASDDYAYARAWSLLALGRDGEAREVIDRQFLAPGTADGLAEYLYLVFRHPSDALLADAEARAREGVTAHPEQSARLNAAHGRILRRQGRLQEAEQAFARAVAEAAPDNPSRGTYVGQLEYVRRELAGSGG